MSQIINFPNADEPIIDPELVAIAEEMLIRVRTGITIGLGIVEHQISDVVAVQVRGGASYHHLNSGTTRLSHLINKIGWAEGSAA